MREVAARLRNLPADEWQDNEEAIAEVFERRGVMVTSRDEDGNEDEDEEEERLMITVKIAPNDKGNPPGKLADAELHFTAGPLDGLKLIGFGVWQRRTDGGRNVTFPARQYSVNGERRSFALLRPIVDVMAQERLRDLILSAYDTHVADDALQGA
ncbi:MAG: hypothetical protein IMZ55_11310 [Acidobacteria bacterium]|nr:hypothetical protein [Acidobacteriota bacterium]